MNQTAKILIATLIAFISMLVVTGYQNHKTKPKLAKTKKVTIPKTESAKTSKTIKVKGLAPKVIFKEGAIAPQAQSNSPKDKSAIKSYLSNDYIKKEISSQVKLFKRCQTNSLRNKKYPEGSILVGFTILPRGKTDKVNIISSNIENTQFKNCIVSIFQRTQFRPFKGKPVAISYPISFE